MAADKLHHQMIKLVGQVCGEIKFASFQHICPKVFINHKGEFSSFKWKNLAEATLTKWWRFISWTLWYDAGRRTRYFMVFSPNVHNLSLIMRKYQVNSNWETSDKIICTLRKYQGRERQEKLRNDYTLQGTQDSCQLLCTPRASPLPTYLILPSKHLNNYTCTYICWAVMNNSWVGLFPFRPYSLGTRKMFHLYLYLLLPAQFKVGTKCTVNSLRSKPNTIS